MTKPIILCDVDGILVDFTVAYLRLLKLHTGRLHTEAEIHSFNYEECIASKAEDEYVWKWIGKTKNFVYNLPTYPGWRTFLANLRLRGRVVACTSPASGRWTAERYQWLIDRAGFCKNDIVITRCKELVHGDFLIDDAHHNVEAWESFDSSGSRVGILFNRPWNAKCSHHTRAATYEEILKHLE